MRRLFFLALFISCQVAAQDFSVELQKKLDEYYQHSVPLKIHVFTNQPEYAAGDTIFFNVNLVRAQGNLPVAGKSIISIALLGTHDEKIIVNRFSIINGTGNNQMILPKTLSAGNYWLSAWTEWMAGDKAMEYRKPLRIGSTAPAFTTLVAAPEGGNLIDGLNSKIVVKGKPYTSGYAHENQNRLVEFMISGDGTTSFYLTAKAGLQYQVVADNSRVLLPEVKSDGIAITVTPVQAKKAVKVYLTAPASSQYRGINLHLVLSKQGIVYQSSGIMFKNQSFIAAELSLDELPEGIAQVTVFDDQQNVITERLIYNFSAEPVSAFVTLQKKQFDTREKIDVTVEIKKGQASVEPSLAATVFHNQFTSSDSSVVQSLQTDFQIYADAGKPDILFTGKEAPSTLDNKLVLLNWKRFDWTNLSERNDNAYHSQYLRFYGKAFDIETNLPLPDSSKITFFLQRDVTTYEAYTLESGKFEINMLVDFYNTDEVFYRVERNGELLPNARVTIDERVLVSPMVNSQSKIKSHYHELFDRRTKVNESYAYHLNENRSFIPEASHVVLEDEIFGADLTITMEDYHLFPSMIETLREIIPVAQHRKIRGRDVVRIFDDELKKFREDDPVYVIDGVMTDDMEYFLSLNPADIETLKLVHTTEKLRMFGAIGKGGIFIIETKIPGNTNKVHRSVRSFTLKGLSEPLVRKTIRHAAAGKSRVPDFRTNLLWLPDLRTDSSGKASITFYASDVPGMYKIEGEGITADGKIVTFSEEFEVIYKK